MEKAFPSLSLFILIKPLEEGAAETVGQLIFEIGTAVHRLLCFLPRSFQKGQVPYNIRRLQVRHAVLVVAEKFTGTPKEEILFGKEETILYFAHELHTELRHFIMIIRIENAV